ncbi:MAG: hypothetical protein GF408_05435, partial [Candidatus Omnitrophica bacterium]|nr:hypothetical protein [Candidatus Omnitrophota bacterium]
MNFNYRMRKDRKWIKITAAFVACIFFFAQSGFSREDIRACLAVSSINSPLRNAVSEALGGGPDALPEDIG